MNSSSLIPELLKKLEAEVAGPAPSARRRLAAALMVEVFKNDVGGGKRDELVEAFERVLAEHTTAAPPH